MSAIHGAGPGQVETPRCRRGESGVERCYGRLHRQDRPGRPLAANDRLADDQDSVVQLMMVEDIRGPSLVFRRGSGSHSGRGKNALRLLERPRRTTCRRLTCLRSA